jgi:hypothetical protein
MFLRNVFHSQFDDRSYAERRTSLPSNHLTLVLVTSFGSRLSLIRFNNRMHNKRYEFIDVVVDVGVGVEFAGDAGARIADIESQLAVISFCHCLVVAVSAAEREFVCADGYANRCAFK